MSSNCRYGIVIHYKDGRKLGPIWYSSEILRKRQERTFLEKLEVTRVQKEERQ